MNARDAAAKLRTAARDGYRAARRRRFIVDRITRDLTACGAWWSISPMPSRKPGSDPYGAGLCGITVCGPRRGVVIAVIPMTPVDDLTITH